MKTKTLLWLGGILAMGLMAPDSYAQIFTFSTIAGGSHGSNDGVNSAAQFSNPTGVAVDSAGNVYVADQLNNAIREISPSGTSWIVTTIAGGSSGSRDGTNVAAAFFGPTGIAVDGATNLYVADQFNHTIRKITPSGTNWVVSTLAGQAGIAGAQNGTNTNAQFRNPTGITVDNAGNLFVADEFNNAIRKITPSGTNWIVNTIAGGSSGSADGTNTVAQFFGPAGVAVDAGDRVFVADQFNNTIRLITPTGTNWVVTTIAGQLDSGASNGLGTNAQFTSPVGVALDSKGNVYVADLFNDAVRELTPTNLSWLVSTIAGGSEGTNNGTGTNAQFFLPSGVTADVYGDVFVADSGNNAIRMGISSSSAPEVGSLEVTITPENAVIAGAEWQVDGGPLQGSSMTLSNLTPGNHSVTFSTVSKFTTPAWQSITVTAHRTTTATGNYPAAIANAGSLEVLISPAAAVAAGAQWRVDGGPFQTNGNIVAGLSVGSHPLSFNTISGWTPPEAQTIIITNSQTTLGLGSYDLQVGSLQITILPAAVVTAGAKWQVDGGTFQASGATLTGLLPGTHTVAFNTILGWTTPTSVTIAVDANQVTPLAGTYLPEPPQLSGLTMSNGAARFFLNGLSGSVCVIQASSNLVSWWAIATNTISATGSVQITDAGMAGHRQRFYRAMVVPNYQPQLSGASLRNGAFQLVLNGSVGSSYVIQASSNLINWSAISTNTISSGGTVSITDPVLANYKARFYRALVNN